MGKALHNKVNRADLKLQVRREDMERTTLSFYAYTKLENPDQFRDDFYRHLEALGVLGRIYVATEGVNAQVSVQTRRLEELRGYLDSIHFLKGIRLNIAIEDDGKSFFTLTIKVREKIVADGLTDPGFDVTDRGIHLNAAIFNQLTEEEDTIVVDMRNHYESEVGHFENAILPPMETFREGLPMVADMLRDEKDKKIIMYCTGGIRCEKASAYLKFKGFKNVYQLEGGIIEYARQVEQQNLLNKFTGKNFVFDERLGERISDEIISACHQCGRPCDDHNNCANDACHLLFIQCSECASAFSGCCSAECQDFNSLPGPERKVLRKKMEFNGTRFSKSKPGMLKNKE
jgi:UPF0176 protein